MEYEDINSSSEDDDGNGSGQLEFALLLKSAKILFNKSQTPEIKNRKEEALKGILKKYEKNFGKSITEKQFKKKLNNMKCDVKKQLDINQTGNRPIQLKKWQKVIADLIDAKDNPSCIKVSNPISVGFDKPELKNVAGSSKPTKPFPSTKRQTEETEETKSLSTAELQRLVLVKQLKLIRVQTERETMLLQDLKNNQMYDPYEEMVVYAPELSP